MVKLEGLKATNDTGSGSLVRSRVAVLKTSPQTVLKDIGLAMNLAEYREVLSRDIATLL